MRRALIGHKTNTRVTYLKPWLEHILICVLCSVLLRDNVVPLLRKYFVSERFRFTIEEKLDSDGVVFVARIVRIV